MQQLLLYVYHQLLKRLREAMELLWRLTFKKQQQQPVVGTMNKMR